MKTKLFLYASLVLILASCSGSHGVMKRKYTKGYYVSNTKKAKAPKSVEAQKTNMPELKEAIVEQKVNSTLTTVNKQTSEQTTPVAGNSFNKTYTQKTSTDKNTLNHKTVASNSKKEIKQPLKFKPVVVAKNVKNERRMNNSAADSGAKLIVMIILCFFPLINLIPVYIHDNGVTLNFWITLLLCLTLIGSIIFSLLVVLDVVNLA